MSKEAPSAKVMFSRAQALERNNQREAAKELYQRILRDHPEHRKSRRALDALGAAAAKKAAPLTEADFNRVLTLANTSLQRAGTEAARLCSLHPGQPALENLRGVILVQMGDYREAVTAFGLALKVEPGFTDALTNLASALGALNRDEEAVKLYERLLAASRKDPDVFYNFGNALLKLGRNYDAVNAYKNALNLRPLFPGAYNNMGKALSLLGQAEQAQTCFENALEIDPAHDKANRNLAQLHSRALRFKAAHALYQRLLSRKPGDVDALFGAAICLINDGDQAAAIAALDRVVKLTPSAQSPRFLLDVLRGESRDTIPNEYTQGLFDGYADRFEQDLVVNLQYQAPALLRDLLGEAVPGPQHYCNALDVGCGTGLAGLAFDAAAERLTGIDLSPAMLAKAQEKGVYRTLMAGDAVELITQSGDTYDLVLCADTLPYIGELPPLFKALAAHTSPGGHFLCSTELAEGGTYALHTSARFAHSPGYVIECAAAAGFDLLAQKTVPLRKDRETWTSGGLYCFARRG